jgi:hypothetical protein
VEIARASASPFQSEHWGRNAEVHSKNENAFVSLSAGERVFLVQAQAQYARDKSFTLQQTEQAANRTSSKQDKQQTGRLRHLIRPP